MLVERYKIDVNCKDNDRCTSLRKASENGSIEVFEYLVENGGAVFIKSKNKKTCLHFAANNGHFNLCKLLVEKYEMDLNCKDINKCTSLHEASVNGNIDVFEYLVEQRGDVYSKSKVKKTCLHFAARNGRLNLCKLLVGNYQIDVNCKDSD